MGSKVIYGITGIIDWIYRYNGKFEIRELLNYIGVEETNENKEACVKFLEHNNLAYRLGFGISPYWISRAAAFGGKKVAVVPTEFELSRGILIPGSRFAPYVTNILEQYSISVMYDKKDIYPELVSIPLKEIRKYYCLYSEEKIFAELTRVSSSNYIDIETYKDENKEYYVPAFNVKRFYEERSFLPNDQLILTVESHMYKDVELYSTSTRATPEVFKREWERKFKKLLKFNISGKPADNNTVVDVLSHTMYMLDAMLSTHDYLIPLQEYLQENKMLENITIGVSNIVWIKDSMPITTDFWYPFTADFRYILQRTNKDEVFFCSLYLPITDPVIEIFVYQFLEENYISINEEPQVYRKKCIDQFIDEFFSAEIYRKFHRKIRSIFSKKYDRFAKKYNPFTKKEEVAIAFGMFALFRRLYRAVERLNKLTLDPCDIAYETAIIVNQMSQDMVDSLHDIHELLEGKVKAQVENFKLGLVDLTEKFSFIVGELEQYIFYNFGDK